jgi:porin
MAIMNTLGVWSARWVTRIACLAVAVFSAMPALADDFESGAVGISYLNEDEVAPTDEPGAEIDGLADEMVSCDAGCCQPSLTSNWQARMNCLCQNMKASGITYNGDLVQFYQGVASGGIEQEFEYGGKVDQFVTLDSTKLGLWQGMTVVMHAETRFGEDVNREAVGLSPVNVAMLYPSSGEHVTAITNLTFTQALDEEWLVSFGKFNALDMYQGLYPETGRGVTGFMNASIVIPLALARVFPLSFMGAGITKMQGTQVQGALTVYDPHDCSTTSGFEELGDNGANIMGLWRFFAGSEDLPGSHMFGFVGATGEFTSLDPAGFIFVPGQGIVSTEQSASWAALYILQQRLWVDHCNADRHIGVLSQWCIADEETSPFEWTGNVAIQGQGLVGGRPFDTAGVGYFYTGLSSEFQSLVSPVADLHDLHGVELYYNAALAKFFGLTADLQVIEPADVGQDTAIVCGLRGTLVF